MVDTDMNAVGANQQYMNIIYTLSDGEPRVAYGFYPSGQPCQIWDFGLSNSVSRVLTVAAGHPPLHAHIVTGQDSLVIGTADPGHLWEYFPKTGATNYIKACSGRDYYSAALGTDGVVVLGVYGSDQGGTNPTAVESYNPLTQAAIEWGKLDVDQGDPCYVYYIGGDANAIYGSIYHFNDPVEWYLGIVQKSDGAKQVFWKGGGSTTLEICKGLNDNNWYIKQGTNSITRYWQLNGTNYPTLLGGNPGMESTYKNSGYNNDPDTWLAEEGWEVEPAFSVVNVAGSVPQSSVRWRKSGAADWTSLTETNNWTTGPYSFQILKPYGNNLIWTTLEYGPIGYLNPGSTATLIAPQAGLSWYDMLVVGFNDVYFSGYHNRTKRWNPTNPWTYSIASSDTDTNVNPHFVTLNTLGKYHYYLAKANDGRIYIGSHHTRGSSGGELGWYNPADNSNGEERTTFLSYDIRDLKPSAGGSNMVYVSSNADGKVFIWDVASDSVETSFSPIASVTLDKVVEYETGKMFGVVGQRTLAFTTSGTLLWTNLLPATAWGTMPVSNHRVTLGPDGYSWQCAGGYLYRISTADGSYEQIMRTTNDYNTVFLNGDLYLYGGTSGTKIWKVSNVLTQVSRLKSTGVRLGNLKGR